MMTRNRNSVKKLLAVALAFITIMAIAMPALAAEERVEATAAMNVRSGPGSNYAIVGELRRGQTVTRYGTTGNWSIIDLNGRRAYASSSYLRVVSSSSGGTSTPGISYEMYTTGRANVRSGPGTSYRILTTLNKGDRVNRIGATGSWTIVEWNGGTAYISTSLLTTNGVSSPSIPASNLMEATSNVNIRTGPSTQYSILGMLYRGDRITATGTSGNWTRVDYGGRTGYISSAYLRPVYGSTPTPTPVPTPPPSTGRRLVATVNVNMRSGPGTNYSNLGVLRQGEVVRYISVSGNWTQVEYNGRAVYVFSSYLRDYQDSGRPIYDEKRYIREETFMYTGPNSSSGVVMLLGRGLEVILIEDLGNWSEIEYGTRSGYVRSDALSRTAISERDGHAYAIERDVPIYAEASTNSRRYGFMNRGEYVVSYGSIGGGFIEVRHQGRTAYVQSKSVRVLTASNQTNFTDDERDMYCRVDGADIYMIPDDHRAYDVGYMNLNDKVTRIAYNRTWTAIEVRGEIYYVKTDTLRENPTER